jgi:uncharacterized coiled-coil DUF342 family protein
MPSKRMVPEQEIAELSDEFARKLAIVTRERDALKADFQNASDAADEWCEKFDRAAEEVRILTEQRDRAMTALRACHDYFAACARAWAANEGRVTNEAGHILVEAEAPGRACR